MDGRKRDQDHPWSPGVNWPKGTQNVRRTIAILRAVGGYGNRGAKLSEIARTVALPTPTVKRILKAMAMESFLTVSPKSKHYYIGYDLYNLIKEARQFHLQEVYRVALESLAEKTEDTVQLITRSGFDAVCLDLVEGVRAVRFRYGIGSRLPLGLGCSGVVLLAFLPQEERERVISINASRYRDHKVKPTQVRAQIQEIQQQGYNLRYESTIIEGMAGTAVPVFKDNAEVLASITVISTSIRMSVHRCQKIAKLIEKEIKALDQ
jgi:DNA-binding IclR family transcriptional regulator